MKKKSNHIIAYCVDNQSVANEIEGQLQPAGYIFEHFSAGSEISYESLGEKLLEKDMPVLLLISDNFLKSAECMKDGLNYLQKLVSENHVLPIVIDGQYENEAGELVNQSTAFDRVSHIIKFMNHWQEKYLELRKAKRGISAEEEPEFNYKLNVVRNISSTIGEFLRYLRSTKHYSFDHFSQNDFEIFFQFANDLEGHQNFKEGLIEPDPLSEQDEVEVAESETANNEPEYIQTDENHLVDLIHASSEDLINENKDLNENLAEDSNEDDDVSENSIIEIEEPDVDLTAIPGMELLNGKGDSPNEEANEEEEQFLESDIKMIKKEGGESKRDQGTIIDIEAELGQETEVAAVESSIDNDYETQFENLSEIVDPVEDNGLETVLEDVLNKPENLAIDSENKPFQLEEILENEGEGLEEGELISESEPEPQEEVENGTNSSSVTLEDLLAGSEVIENTDKTIEETVSESLESETESNDLEESFNESVHNLGKKIEEIKPKSLKKVLKESNKHFEKGEVEEGLLVIKSALNADPTDTAIRYHYAHSLGKYNNDFHGAIDELETLLSFDPNHEDAYFLLAELAELHKDYFLAKNYYEKVEAINPQYPNIAYKLGLLNLNYFKENQKEAASYFKKAIKANKKNTDARYRLAIILNEYFGKHWKAVKHFKKVLKLSPEHPFANYDLAVLYHRLGDRPLAHEYYQKAIEINPEFQTPRNDEAFKYALSDNVDESSMPNIFDNEEDPEFTELKKDMARLEAKMIELNQPDSIEEAEDLFNDVAIEDNEEVLTHETIVSNEIAEEVLIDSEISTDLEPKGFGKVVLITGATAGIGKATAEIFAKEGYRVIMTGRRSERLESIKKDLEENFQAKIQTLSFDIKDMEAGQNALSSLPEEWQDIDILINNAGMGKGYANFYEGDIKDWDEMIDTNIRGLLYLTRAISPSMVKRKSGHIINVASTSGKYVSAKNVVYSATKFAVEGLTKSLRVDLFPHNIRVSQISPAMVKTEFASVRLGKSEAEASDYYSNFKALNPEDVAETIFFIASRPGHVNIQDIEMWSTYQLSPTVFKASEEEE